VKPPPWLTRAREGNADLLPLEPHRPLAEGLEWRLSHYYWETRGPEAFYGGEVPYLSINDGRLSEDAADLFLRTHRRRRGPLRVLELGAGSGLFAKLFLDHLRRVDPSFADRVHYAVSDGTRRMVDALAASPLFDAHRGRVDFRLLHAPALTPDPGQFDLVVGNYFLDILPSTTLFLDRGQAWELLVRACLPAAWDSRAEIGLERSELLARLAEPEWNDPRLAEVYAHLVLDCRLEPRRRAELPRPDGLPTGKQVPRGWWPHGAQALDCLDGIVDRLRPGGYALVQDYGFVEGGGEEGERPFCATQRFGGSLSNGVNFPQIAAWARRRGWVAEAPPTDSTHVRSRWIGRPADRAARSAFRELFDGPRRDRVPDLLEQSREAIRLEEIETARARLLRAAELRPHCWHALERLSALHIYQVPDYLLAREVAEAGLALHPCNSSLLNDRGDAWFHEKDYARAEADFLLALRHHPGDARARFNLALVCAATGRPAEALRWIGEALAADARGAYREGLLAKQQEILHRLAQTREARQQRENNRFRNLPSPPTTAQGAESSSWRLRPARRRKPGGD
jgi:hypothetical protein